MHVWRLASGRYPPLEGEGARLAGGRWNFPGQPLVYTSESVALCLAECLVHVTGPLPRNYQAIEIVVPDEAIEFLDVTAFRRGRQRNLRYTRTLGEQWLATESSLALAVPSAVLPSSTNVLLNPLHPRAGELKVVSRKPFRFDPRLRP